MTLGWRLSRQSGTGTQADVLHHLSTVRAYLRTRLRACSMLRAHNARTLGIAHAARKPRRHARGVLSPSPAARASSTVTGRRQTAGRALVTPAYDALLCTTARRFFVCCTGTRVPLPLGVWTGRTAWAVTWQRCAARDAHRALKLFRTATCAARAGFIHRSAALHTHARLRMARRARDHTPRNITAVVRARLPPPAEPLADALARASSNDACACVPHHLRSLGSSARATVQQRCVRKRCWAFSGIGTWAGLRRRSRATFSRSFFTCAAALWNLDITSLLRTPVPRYSDGSLDALVLASSERTELSAA